MIGVILAAGDGTRLKNSANTQTCKALTKINEIHLIEFSLNNLIAMGISDVYIVVGKNGETICETIGFEYKDLAVSYVYQQQQKGLIHAFVQALAHVDNEDVVLQLADEILVDFKSAEIDKMLIESSYDFYCGYTHENNPVKIKNNYSVETDEKGIVKYCTEKPTIVTNKIKGTGFCIFRKNAVNILKKIYDESLNAPNDLCDFINYLSSQQNKGKAFCVAQKEFNINTQDDLSEAMLFFNASKNG